MSSENFELVPPEKNTSNIAMHMHFCKLEWNVYNFSSISLDKDLLSPSASSPDLPDFKWSIGLSVSLTEEDKLVTIFLKPDFPPCSRVCCFQYSLFIGHSNNKLISEFNGASDVSSDRVLNRTSHRFRYADVTDDLQSDSLRLAAEVAFVFLQPDSVPNKTMWCLPPANRLLADVSVMFKKNALSDVVISVINSEKRVTIPAHRFVLAARSPVFQEMLSKDMPKNEAKEAAYKSGEAKQKAYEAADLAKKAADSAELVKGEEAESKYKEAKEKFQESGENYSEAGKTFTEARQKLAEGEEKFLKAGRIFIERGENFIVTKGKFKEAVKKFKEGRETFKLAERKFKRAEMKFEEAKEIFEEAEANFGLVRDEDEEACEEEETSDEETCDEDEEVDDEVGTAADKVRKAACKAAEAADNAEEAADEAKEVEDRDKEVAEKFKDAERKYKAAGKNFKEAEGKFQLAREKIDEAVEKFAEAGEKFIDEEESFIDTKEKFMEAVDKFKEAKIKFKEGKEKYKEAKEKFKEAKKIFEEAGEKVESTESEDEDLCIRIHDIGPDIVSHMLDYMYTDTFDDNLGADETLELLKCSDRYSVSGLKNLCELSLIRKINEENSCKCLFAADRYNAEMLKAKALDIICKTKRSFAKMKEFMDSNEGYQEQKLKILSEINYQIAMKCLPD